MIQKKFLLSTGQTTVSEIDYILDLFRLYLSVNPGDIPGLPDFGFNFTFAGIPKSGLIDHMKFRLESFLRVLQDSFPSHRIEIDRMELVTETEARLSITVDGTPSTDMFINIYENS